jgi:calmodulin
MLKDYLTEDQAKECKEVFDLFDNQKEGLILASDLGNALRALGMNPTLSEVEDMLNEININPTNNKIEITEFAEQYAKMLKDPDTDEDLLECFKIFDKDNSGIITPSELRHIMSTFGENFPEEEIAEMIRKGDPHNEGYIRYEELVKLMMQKN